MENNNTNQPRAEKKEVIRSEYAQYAHSARPQFIDNIGKVGDEGTPHFPKFVYEKAPELLQAGCSVLKTDRQRDMLLTSALTILSGCFNTVTGLYDGKMANANLYCILVAPPASDKSVMNWAKELGMGIHTRFIAENESALKKYSAESALYKASAKILDGNAAVPLPIEPVRHMLYVPANSSSAAVMKQIHDNNGSGIICESEIDTLANALKQDWGNFDDLLRKAFHQEMFSYARKTNNEHIEVLNPKIAVALSGTPAQVSRLLVSNENGLVSRFIFYYSNAPAVWRDVSPIGSINLGLYYQALAGRVLDMYNRIKDAAIEFELPAHLWEIHNEMFKSKLVRANEDMSSAILRLGIITFKIAMVLSILRNEKSLPLDGKLTCGDMDYRIAMVLAGVYEKHADLVYRSLLVPKYRPVETSKMTFFEALPDMPFATKDAIALGSTLSIAERTVGKYLTQLCESSLLFPVKYGVYCKA